MDQEAMLVRISTWATSDENMRAVVVTGSLARGDADGLSDVDVELYLRDPAVLLDRRDWYGRFGDVLAVEELKNPGRIPTRLLYLVDGKIDFTIGDLAAFEGRVYLRPFRVLIDKDDRAGVLSSASSSDDARPPTPEQYAQCVNWFAAAALMQARLIVRNEPWAAKFREWDLKGQLLRMIVWDHRSRYGWDLDTWYTGKHISQWADTDICEQIEPCWAGYRLSEMSSALLSSLTLFQHLADRTAEALDLPAFHHDRIRDEVERILHTR